MSLPPPFHPPTILFSFREKELRRLALCISPFVRSLSHNLPTAAPAVASYQFTTLRPYVGVLQHDNDDVVLFTLY